jgi:N-acetyl-anhydromuramyl-L-alanine amidase AmpD
MAWFPQGRPISPRWTHVVVHHSATAAGGARRFDSYHRHGNGWDELGYHFVIGNGTDTPDGYVEVGSRWHKQKHGAHCKTPDNYFNDHGVGICLVGDFTRSRPTPRQMESLARLVKFLGDQCGIPPGRVTTHHAVKHSTQCPGRFFEMQALQRRMDRVPVASALP